jgi:hypothetical protein
MSTNPGQHALASRTHVRRRPSRNSPCNSTVTLSTLDQSVPASCKISPTFWIQTAVSFLIPPGTIVLLTKGTCPLTKTRSPKMVPPDKVFPTAPRRVMSWFRRAKGSVVDATGDALATASKDARRPKLRSIVVEVEEAWDEVGVRATFSHVEFQDPPPRVLAFYTFHAPRNMCRFRDSTSHRSADELSDSLSQNSGSLNPEDLSLASSQPYLTLRFSPSRQELAALR